MIIHDWLLQLQIQLSHIHFSQFYLLFFSVLMTHWTWTRLIPSRGQMFMLLAWCTGKLPGDVTQVGMEAVSSHQLFKQDYQHNSRFSLCFDFVDHLVIFFCTRRKMCEFLLCKTLCCASYCYKKEIIKVCRLCVERCIGAGKIVIPLSKVIVTQ